MKKNQRLTPVRLSHLLGFSSVGAVVRGPHYLMVVSDISQWLDPHTKMPTGKPIYYVERVKHVLGIDKELRLPPVAQIKDERLDGVYVPARIFPSWVKCNRCHFLSYKPWHGNERNFPLSCSKDGCGGKLEQMPWVLVHEHGFLSDLHYHWLTHRRSPNKCEPDWYGVYLKARPKGKQYQLSCLHCGAQDTIALGEKIPWSGTQQPWLKDKLPPDILSNSPMGNILAVGDPRVHFVDQQSALVIPPESRIKRGSVVDRFYSSADNRNTLRLARSDLIRKREMKIIAEKLGCTVAELKDAIEQIENGYPLYGNGHEVTIGSLLESEYKALLELIADLSEDEDFVTRHYQVEWRALKARQEPESLSSKIMGLVDAVVGVERLKEIMVMKGFGRLEMDPEKATIVPPDVKGEADWLPALELYGEGIFLTLDQKVLAEWEEQPALTSRIRHFENRYANASVRFNLEPNLSPRFMLLHALSHALIRQLESYAGYPAASLKERIYCARNGGMAGILIYVAVPDIVGSLGGLAELAIPERLLPVLLSVFEQVQWCSLDPVCVEHEGQGVGLLNKAACHGCMLVPETSCSFGNLLLDRIFLKGNQEEGIASVLDYIGG